MVLLRSTFKKGWWRGRPWSRRSFRRYILWLHIFNILLMCIASSSSSWCRSPCQQEALLLQRDRATCYLSKFALRFTRYGS